MLNLKCSSLFVKDELVKLAPAIISVDTLGALLSYQKW